VVEKSDTAPHLFKALRQVGDWKHGKGGGGVVALKGFGLEPLVARKVWSKLTEKCFERLSDPNPVFFFRQQASALGGLLVGGVDDDNCSVLTLASPLSLFHQQEQQQLLALPPSSSSSSHGGDVATRRAAARMKWRVAAALLAAVRAFTLAGMRKLPGMVPDPPPPQAQAPPDRPNELSDLLHECSHLKSSAGSAGGGGGSGVDKDQGGAQDVNAVDETGEALYLALCDASKGTSLLHVRTLGQEGLVGLPGLPKIRAIKLWKKVQEKCPDDDRLPPPPPSPPPPPPPSDAERRAVPAWAVEAGKVFDCERQSQQQQQVQLGKEKKKVGWSGAAVGQSQEQGMGDRGGGGAGCAPFSVSSSSVPLSTPSTILAGGGSRGGGSLSGGGGGGGGALATQPMQQQAAFLQAMQQAHHASSAHRSKATARAVATSLTPGSFSYGGIGSDAYSLLSPLTPHGGGGGGLVPGTPAYIAAAGNWQQQQQHIGFEFGSGGGDDGDQDGRRQSESVERSVLFGWDRLQEQEGGFLGEGAGSAMKAPSSSSFANNDGGGGDSDSDDDDLPLVPVLEWVLPRTVTVVLDNGKSGAGEVEGLLKGSSSELVAIADNFVFRNQGLKKRKQSSDVIVRAVSNPPPHLPYYFLFFCSYQWSPKESSRDMNLG